ncbi:uncharacterized protein LOC116416130 [Nasonia vitripennis]|uniref:F-box domain-containing protein n=1 Tax=Nasonia vitripennis TaxID=7425 RepID=A0A7M7Q0N6_NASVI|nr:uncharacterized protein LOC116416130 [Nasonia vitripennis]
MVQTRSMQRKSGGALCGDFVPQRRRTQRIAVREENAETILRDAIDVVFKYLDMRDLHAASQVCSSWNVAAAREATKRSHIQQLLIPHNSEDLANSNSVYHIPAALSVKPCVALFFVESRLIEEFNFGRSDSSLPIARQMGSVRTLAPPMMDNHFENCFMSPVFNVYKQQLPEKLIGMEVSEYTTDKHVAMPKELKQQVTLEAAGSQSILGIFLPKKKELNVRVAWCENFNDDVNDVADNIADQLIFDDLPENYGSAMLVFAQSLAGYFLAEKVVLNVTRKYPSRNEHAWGGLFGNELGATNCQEIDSSIDNKKIFVGLRIASPGLQTWMTVIDCSDRRDEVVQKLQEFRQQVQRKKHTIGLAYGPKFIRPFAKSNIDLFYDGQDVMRAIKGVFTDIGFSGFLNRDSRILISSNAIDEELCQRMSRDKFMTLIVIAYD